MVGDDLTVWADSVRKSSIGGRSACVTNPGIHACPAGLMMRSSQKLSGSLSGTPLHVSAAPCRSRFQARGRKVAVASAEPIRVGINGAPKLDDGCNWELPSSGVSLAWRLC